MKKNTFTKENEKIMHYPITQCVQYSALGLILCCLLLLGCKKESRETGTLPVASEVKQIWLGSYGNYTSEYSYNCTTPLTIVAYEKDIMNVFINDFDTSKAIKAKGTYNISGNTLSLNYETENSGVKIHNEIEMDSLRTYGFGTWDCDTCSKQGVINIVERKIKN